MDGTHWDPKYLNSATYGLPFRPDPFSDSFSDWNTLAPLGTITSASYCNIPAIPGPGNIDADPLWVNPENGDYQLLPNSPCIDAGTNTGLTVDLDGNPRPVDVAGRGFEGACAYDMGCYEFQLKKSDLNKDGYVNAVDLIQFQEEWMREEGVQNSSR